MKTFLLFIPYFLQIIHCNLALDLDFSKAVKNPETGALCVMQEVCLPNLEALASQLPQGPCLPQGEDCNCAQDSDCGGGSAK